MTDEDEVIAAAKQHARDQMDRAEAIGRANQREQTAAAQGEAMKKRDVAEAHAAAKRDVIANIDWLIGQQWPLWDTGEWRDDVRAVRGQRAVQLLRIAIAAVRRAKP